MEERLEITIALSAVSMKTHLSSIRSTLLEEDTGMDEQEDNVQAQGIHTLVP